MNKNEQLRQVLTSGDEDGIGQFLEDMRPFMQKNYVYLLHAIYDIKAPWLCANCGLPIAGAYRLRHHSLPQLCPDCIRKRNSKLMRRRYAENPKHRLYVRAKSKEYFESYGQANNTYIKTEVLTHYGNGQCACVNCGEARLACLSIDHINGRRPGDLSGSGWILYGKLKKDNFPPGYQTLCMNCQFIKRTKNGEMTLRKALNPYRANQRIYAKRKRQELKQEILTHYGRDKLACVKCGFGDIRALSLDHINGGGKHHKQQLGLIGTHFYKWVKDNNFPQGYQTLCMNCQFTKRVENQEVRGS